jgi:AbiV family abortive infection protein
MAILAFRNALRFHEDSIYLFRRKSFASSFALSVLACEEIGKYLLLEDFIWHSKVDGPFTPQEAEKFLEMFYSHRAKQAWFAGNYIPSLTRRMIGWICEGRLEEEKQRALYVGLPRRQGRAHLKGRVVTPFNVGRKRAESLITLVNDFFMALTIGVRTRDLMLDVEELNSLLTFSLAKRLHKLWPQTGASAKRYIHRIMGGQNTFVKSRGICSRSSRRSTIKDMKNLKAMYCSDRNETNAP